MHTNPISILKTEMNSVAEYERSERYYEMWEMKERSSLGELFDESDVENIAMWLNDLLDSSVQLESLRNTSVYNFGKAGEVADQQIIDIVQQQISNR